MVIRDYITCETCGHEHTIRLGMGNDEYQPHHFPCKSCGENISVALKVDFENITTELVLIENAVKGTKEGSIVNLDALFLPNPDHLDTDHMEQRVKQAHKYLMTKKENMEEKYGAGSFEKFIELPQNTRIVPFSDEWKLLKKCWSLNKRQQHKLAERFITKANQEYYGQYEPLSSFYDWLWRFSFRLSGQVYDNIFEDISNSIISSCGESSELKNFTDKLREGLFEEHLEIYFDIFKQFFASYPEFNQVYTYCSTGMKIPDGHQATSRNFDAISGFYGNAFEAFTSLVETLACTNNIIAGRTYDQFETMTLRQYKKLDKASRCNPFSENQSFTKLCNNVDNQLRNASHHGGFRFNQENGIIKYRAGKGGNGEEREITYTDYILQCTNLLLAIATLLRLELIMHEHM